MLDTKLCSYIMRESPVSVLAKLQSSVESKNEIVISAITYAELRFGAVGKKASPRHDQIVSSFVGRIDHILPYGKLAVEKTAEIKKYLAAKGTPIGLNDSMIAGHAIATDCTIVTNNTREFSRVPDLVVEDWVASDSP